MSVIISSLGFLRLEDLHKIGLGSVTSPSSASQLHFWKVKRLKMSSAACGAASSAACFSFPFEMKSANRAQR